MIESEQINNDTILIKSKECKAISDEEARKRGTEHALYRREEPLHKTGRDFELFYTVKTENIIANCIEQPDPLNKGSGSFCLFVTPPSSIQTTFGRSFYFLLDRSGSMVGEPYLQAVRALSRALDRLRSSDTFNICAFDHRQIHYSSVLVSANKSNTLNAKEWLKRYVPERGGTVIDAPLNTALQCLDKSELLPFVVLITDGAVHNEREICADIKDRQSNHLRTRILTLGIGSYCNWFFLKMLSKTGRGFGDIVLYKEYIFDKTDHLLRMASTPVLTDIEIGLNNNANLDLYPYPIPDLFTGKPIIVAGRYNHGFKLPDTIAIQGFDPHGKQIQIISQVITNHNIPIDKIFVKQQIDLLTADAWYTGNKNIENQIIQVSVDNSMPSNYTSVIAFETTRNDLQRQGLDIEYNNRSNDNEYKDNNNNNNDNDNDKNNDNQIKKEKTWKQKLNNKKTIGALAVGGTALIIGAALFSQGDVGATLDNLPLIGGDALRKKKFFFFLLFLINSKQQTNKHNLK